VNIAAAIVFSLYFVAPYLLITGCSTVLCNIVGICYEFSLAGICHEFSSTCRRYLSLNLDVLYVHLTLPVAVICHEFSRTC
jgi:hypothetical protein